MRTFRPALVAALLAVAGTVLVTAPPGSDAAVTPKTRHFIANLGGSTAPAKLGFDVFDIGSSRGQTAMLPKKVSGLVWLGQHCPTPADAAFKSTINRLARNPKVFGYYLSDEPHIRDCPRGPANMATRAAYIRKVSGGRQKSFVVINQSTSDWDAGYRDYKAYRPAVSKVDLIGVDVYPCSFKGCDFSKIGYKVGLARKSGIPLRAIVPVYQAFGQERASTDNYYRMPSATQARKMLARWRKVVPHPVMDYAYGWRNQGPANPTLVDRSDIQAVFQRFFVG